MDKLNSVTKAGSNYAGGAMPISGPTLSEGSRAAIKGTRWEAMDNEIDSNLGTKIFLNIPLWQFHIVKIIF